MTTPPLQVQILSDRALRRAIRHLTITGEWQSRLAELRREAERRERDKEPKP